MKTIRLFKRKFYVKARQCFVINTLFGIVFLFAGNGFAQETYPIEYTVFLAETENIFLLHPNLIRKVFFGLVDLRGNRSISRQNLNRDLFRCQGDARTGQGCRIQQLKLERKRQHVTGKLIVPVNFTHISAKRHNRTKKRITLRWRPELIEPPSIDVTGFLNQVWAARESKYFRVKKGIRRIQLNPNLEREIFFITENSLANSLMNVYKQIPEDKNDSITFVFDYVVSSKRIPTMDYFIHFKATGVHINHQDFKTVERKK